MADDPIAGATRFGRRPRDHRFRISRLTVRWTPDEIGKIKTRATACGVATSELIRRTCFRRPLPQPIPALNRDAWIKLGPLAAELENYSRAIRERDPAAPALQLLERIHREIAALREELLGRGVEDEPLER